MHRFILVSLFVVFAVLLSCCGGASVGDQSSADYDELTDEELGVRMNAENMVPRGILTRADFTTEVDPKR